MYKILFSILNFGLVIIIPLGTLFSQNIDLPVGEYFGETPHISPDGKSLFWRSNKPFPDDWAGTKPKPGTTEAIQYWVNTHILEKLKNIK